MIVDGRLAALADPEKTLEEIWELESEKRQNTYKTLRTKALSFEKIFGLDEEEAERLDTNRLGFQ